MTTPRSEHSRLRNLNGEVFGRLTVIGLGPKTGNGRYKWLCRCRCGTLRLVPLGNLRYGTTRSCGCLAEDLKRGRRVDRLRPPDKKHSTEYWSFASARNRCRNPNYHEYRYYGGRGIEFRFESFTQFLAVLGPKPGPEYSVNRIDNDGHYEPGNVEWATRKEQNRNKRNVHRITIDGLTLSASEWAENAGVVPGVVISSRIRGGWCDRCAVTRPLALNQAQACPHKEKNAEGLVNAVEVKK